MCYDLFHYSLKETPMDETYLPYKVITEASQTCVEAGAWSEAMAQGLLELLKTTPGQAALEEITKLCDELSTAESGQKPIVATAMYQAQLRKLLNTADIDEPSHTPFLRVLAGYSAIPPKKA